jgi:hypothetical protein
MPVIFGMSLIEDKRLLRVPLNLRNGYILVRRERRVGFRLVIAVVVIFGAVLDINQQFRFVSLVSDLFFWLYIYFNEALFPMGTPRRRAAKAGVGKSNPAIHIPDW